MSETADAVVLPVLRTKLHELELDHVQLAGRIMEIRECIALLEGPTRRRPGRPRNAAALNPAPPQLGESRANAADILEMPGRVGGGTHQPPEAA